MGLIFIQVITELFAKINRMKIRIKENTIRIRLTNKEMQVLLNNEEIKDQTEFPSSVLSYRLKPSDSSKVEFTDNCIQINLTRNQIETLSATDNQAISIEIISINGNKLSILVEQDLMA